MNYLLDTNSISTIYKKNIEIEKIINKGQLYTTNVQFSEISNIKNKNEKHKQLNLYNSLNMIKLQLNTGIWSNNLRWDNKQLWINDKGQDFEELNGNSNKQVHDSLIGEVAKINNLILVTNDRKLTIMANSIEINTLTIEEFLNT